MIKKLKLYLKINNNYMETTQNQTTQQQNTYQQNTHKIPKNPYIPENQQTITGNNGTEARELRNNELVTGEKIYFTNIREINQTEKNEQ